MLNTKIIVYMLILLIGCNMILPTAITQANSFDSIISTLSGTTPGNSVDGGLINAFLSFLYDKLIGPLLNNFPNNNDIRPSSTPIQVPPWLIDKETLLHGKTIIVDPGHGGSNPGAAENGFREADNNLAVGLKLRSKLVQAGAKVIMTRESDVTVATEGKTLKQELQARLDIAKANNADIFVSVHTNSSTDRNVNGAMTFYPNGKATALATTIQEALVKETSVKDKGISGANFYVLRNASMPSTLVEMGFISNKSEATILNSDSYREKIAEGIYKGIASYLTNIN